jgi:hypothetical protein
MNQGELIIAILGIVILVSQGVTAWSVLTGRGNKREIAQPLITKSQPEFVTHAEHTEKCSHMERRVCALEVRATVIERKMETDKEEIIAAGEDRVVGIHRRIDEMQGSIAATPARTIELLKSTKGLL